MRTSEVYRITEDEHHLEVILSKRPSTGDEDLSVSIVVALFTIQGILYVCFLKTFLCGFCPDHHRKRPDLRRPNPGFFSAFNAAMAGHGRGI